MVSTRGDDASKQAAAALDPLIADARAGSSAALDRLIELLAEQLWAELGNRAKPLGLGPSKGISDLIQDTLVRVREKFTKFERHTFLEFKQWARAVLHRRRQEWIRNFRARNNSPKRELIWRAIHRHADPSKHGRVDAVVHREETDRAAAAFECLRQHERFVIQLRLIEGLKHKQVAELTGMSEEACRKSYDRAIVRLRKLFDRHGKQ